MTVPRVYWHFEALANYIRLTNPWGDGSSDKKSEPCAKCGEYEEHRVDCTFRDVPLVVEPGVKQHTSGFDFGAKAAASNVKIKPGIDVLHKDHVRAQDAFLADLIDEALQEG